MSVWAELPAFRNASWVISNWETLLTALSRANHVIIWTVLIHSVYGKHILPTVRWHHSPSPPPPQPTLPTQTGHGVADRAEGVATSDGEQAPVRRNHQPQQEKMGETEEERDNVGKLFENFVQASTCKETLQAFNVLCRQLDLDPADSNTFYSSLKERLTTWKAKALWSKLDKRMSHKEYDQRQACVGTKVGRLVVFILSQK